MPTNGNPQTLNPAVGPDTPPVILSPEEVVQYLRNLRQQIPLASGELTALSYNRRLSHVDAKFVEAAINAIGAASGVEKLLGRTDEELRQEVAVAGRWTAVADELRALLQSIVASNVVRRQRIGLAALQTYKICQQLARDENNVRLNTHIGEMKRLNRFGRARRKPQPPADGQLQPQSKV